MKILFFLLFLISCCLSPSYIFAIDTRDIARFGINFEDSFVDSLAENIKVLTRDSCSDDDRLTTYYNCQDNYDILTTAGRHNNLHDYQQDLLAYIATESAFDAIKATETGIYYYDIFNHYFRPWGNININENNGKVSLFAPIFSLFTNGLSALSFEALQVIAEKDKAPKDWKLSLSPKIYQKDSSFGYGLGAQLEFKFFNIISSNISWKIDENELGANLEYKINGQNSLSINVASNNEENRGWAFYTLHF